MNNAYLKSEDEYNLEAGNLPILRAKVSKLTETLEALEKIAGSNFWTVLKQNVFDVDLEKAKRRLVSEKDTTEIFRLQGEIGWGEKFSLENLISKYRDELLVIRKKLNE